MCINFSFIIPHKNSNDLLKRCVASIPKRDDVEIIIVDDNSYEPPCINYPGIKTVFLDTCHSKGAGHARNEGLKKARGKWVLFIDADDTYKVLFGDFLDKYKNADEDVIYFNYDEIHGDNIKANACLYCNSNDDNLNQFKMKYCLTVPWNKMVKRQFIVDNNIWFEECPVGNDIFYTYQIGYFAGNHTIIEPQSVYNYYINTGSIIHKKKNDELYYLTIFYHIYQQNEFFTFLGDGKYRRTILSKLTAILIKKGLSQFLLAVKVYFKHYSEIQKARYAYVNHFIKERE